MTLLTSGTNSKSADELKNFINDKKKKDKIFKIKLLITLVIVTILLLVILFPEETKTPSPQTTPQTRANYKELELMPISKIPKSSLNKNKVYILKSLRGKTFQVYISEIKEDHYIFLVRDQDVEALGLETELILTYFQESNTSQTTTKKNHGESREIIF